MQAFLTPRAEELMRAAIDIAEPRYEVEVKTTKQGDKLWINVDGVCILRIQRIESGMLKIVQPDGG